MPLGPFYDDYHAEHVKIALDCTKACELARAFREGSEMSVGLEREIYFGRLVKFAKAVPRRAAPGKDTPPG